MMVLVWAIIIGVPVAVVLVSWAFAIGITRITNDTTGRVLAKAQGKDYRPSRYLVDTHKEQQEQTS